MPYKVGEIARRCGVTVRTLHHYEDVGLVVPWRSPSGHRLYSDAHLARLYRVLALRQLGLGLDEIGAMLDGEGGDALSVVRQQIAALDASIRQQQALVERLRALERCAERGEPMGAESLLDVMEVMTMVEQYYTEEQRAALAQRRDALGPDGMKAAEDAWRTLFADVKAAIDRGVEQQSPEAAALGDRWQALIDAFTGHDPGIERSLDRVWAERGDDLRQAHGMDPAVMAWMGAVLAAR